MSTQRPSSRLLIIDVQSRVLLFKFEHTQGPLAGQRFWATPGGGLDPGETYEQAACREMFEETGLIIGDPGAQIARRIATFQTPDGDTVQADERYFLIRANNLQLSDERWTELEHEVMTEARWWSLTHLRSTEEQIWPENLTDLLVRAGISSADH
jgi:8-oxo-dGTP pyrophosphatase MutT (NUDIX family)